MDEMRIAPGSSSWLDTDCPSLPAPLTTSGSGMRTCSEPVLGLWGILQLVLEKWRVLDLWASEARDVISGCVGFRA